MVVQTVWKVGRDGIEAGTNLVPYKLKIFDILFAFCVWVLGFCAKINCKGFCDGSCIGLSFFVLKSLLSTVFFVQATMGLVYFTFIALNKDEGPKGRWRHHLYTKGGGDGGQSRRSQKNHGEV
ncbi:uncharacterized protein Pyn_37074 [Prunus yedoensis var. nudiflora]|uniref:Uncharacterized protein n=1 Tax=Prunus yedoensis var. nudiflora TaxID=2094558 RepID=A0A314YKJ6_PRUYE|nr:uncharacterized protein Pyn_37074 [Prunus yedoensis var. nudiflora]